MKKYFALVILVCFALSSCKNTSNETNPPKEEILQKEEAQNKDQKSEVDDIANDSKDIENKSEDGLKQEESSSDANKKADINNSDSKDTENVFVESSFKNGISYKEFIKKDDDFSSYDEFVDYIFANGMVDVDEEDKKAWESFALYFTDFPTNIFAEIEKDGIVIDFSLIKFHSIEENSDDEKILAETVE